jgi:hypothetical protein
VSGGAVQEEEDLSEITAQMREGNAAAKRSFDTKIVDR